MQTFSSDGVEIAYWDEGCGKPILLLHGFASNTIVNWQATGWFETLISAGHRVIAFDHRGHGESEKLYNLEDYGGPLMAEDARRLLDHLNLAQVNIMGYSMGARVSAFLALNHPGRVNCVVLAGMGHNLVRGVGAPGPIARALEAPSIEDVTNETARGFRAFAERTNSDLRALAACMRSSREKIRPEALADLDMPVLVAVGTDDVIAGPAAPLAELIPNAHVLDIPDRDHMLAVADKAYKKGVLDFLSSV